MSLCPSCGGVIDLKAAMQSKNMAKEIETLRQKMESLKRNMFRLAHNYPATMTDERINEMMAEEEKDMEFLRKKGYMVRLKKDGTFTKSKPKCGTE